MKKNYLIAIIFILLIGGGLYLYSTQKKPSLPKNSQPQTQNQNQPEKKENKTIFNSLKEALSKSQSLKCEFTDKEGRKVTLYLKNNWVRSNYQGVSEIADYLYRDEKMYTWDAQKKEGVIVPINLDQTQKETKANDEKKDNDYIEQYEEYKNFCQIENVSDSVFSPPDDVNFQDMSNLQQMMGK